MGGGGGGGGGVKGTKAAFQVLAQRSVLIAALK